MPEGIHDGAAEDRSQGRGQPSVPRGSTCCRAKELGVRRERFESLRAAADDGSEVREPKKKPVLRCVKDIKDDDELMAAAHVSEFVPAPLGPAEAPTEPPAEMSALSLRDCKKQ